MQARAVVLSAMLMMGTLARAEAPRSATTAPAAPTTQGVAAKSAADAAKLYADQMIAGKGAAVIEEFWDMNAFIDAMFADDLARISEADRGEIKEIMGGFFRSVYADKALVDFMKQVYAKDFAETPADAAGITDVKFKMVAPNGTELPNSLRFKSNNAGHWRIIEAEADGKNLSKVFAAQYASVRSQYTPVQWMCVMLGAKAK